MLLGSLLLLGVGLCLLAGLTLWQSSRQFEQAAGLPLAHAEVVYSDTGAWEEIARPLKSEVFWLVGKPDYVLRTTQGMIPVEVKPLRRARQPYLSDVMQLAAYCLLIEDTSGIAPHYGLLRYAHQTFKIKWDNQLRDQLLQILDEMRELYQWPAMINAQMPTPQHDMTVRCRHCGFHYVCWPKP
jgi:CRISPR-associated exonuclease Cas4